MVMDGQGGGIGKTIIKRLRDVYAEEIEILALGDKFPGNISDDEGRSQQGGQQVKTLL